MTDLVTVAGTRMNYRPHPLPLPAGETEVTIYLVSASNAWKPVARFSLRVAGQ